MKIIDFGKTIIDCIIFLFNIAKIFILFIINFVLENPTTGIILILFLIIGFLKIKKFN